MASASSPLAAWATTVMSGSSSSRATSACRTMVWSSAIMMRTLTGAPGPGRPGRCPGRPGRCPGRPGASGDPGRPDLSPGHPGPPGRCRGRRGSARCRRRRRDSLLVGRAGRGERDGDPHPEPAMRARARQQGPAEAARPFGQPGQAGSRGAGDGSGLPGLAAGERAAPGRRPGAVVGQLGAGAGAGHRDGDPGVPGAGVAHDVGAALPDRPRQQGVHLRRQVVGARRIHPAVDAGRGQHPAGGGELGGQARLPVAGDRLPHLGERATGDRLQLGDLTSRPAAGPIRSSGRPARS